MAVACGCYMAARLVLWACMHGVCTVPFAQSLCSTARSAAHGCQMHVPALVNICPRTVRPWSAATLLPGVTMFCC